MNKLPLFASTKERLLFYSFSITLLIAQILFYYNDYNKFISSPLKYVNAEVISTKYKIKNSKKYQVLKIEFDGNLAYIITYQNRDFRDTTLYLKLYPQSTDISFISYLRGFYINSKILEISKKPPHLQNILEKEIYSQHNSPLIASLYSAIFLATPLHPEVRKRVTTFGINHLIALSGFHLGILWGTIFIILLPIYKLLQKNFFPWRNRGFDLGSIALFILFNYLLLVGSPPSLVRSYVMILFGWIALIFWIELVSFEFLGVVVLTILMVKSKFLFSLSFWLSVSGVFYIFLILKYSKKYLSTFQTALILPIAIYILMIPITHSIFDEVSIYQWLSPVISWIFIPFYPISILIHILGYGDFFDKFLLHFLSLELPTSQKLLPTQFLYIYIFFSLLSIRYKFAFFTVLTMSLFGAIYLYF